MLPVVKKYTCKWASLAAPVDLYKLHYSRNN